MDIQELTSTPVTRVLDERGIPYRFFKHPGVVYSLEQAASERGQRPEQIIRSILFRISRRGFVLVLVPGENQVSWLALRKHLGTSRISMATETEVLQVTGYTLGAVSPLGIVEPLRILADQKVFHEEEVSIGSGVRYTTVILRSADLLRALGAVEIGDFSASSDLLE